MKTSIMSKICNKGLWDDSIPGITFDEDGVSNYAKIQDALCDLYPRNDSSIKKWESLVEEMKLKGKGKAYDCIIGVSGGTDSCYLLYLAKEVYGLRPLAVNLDNGWSSDIAVKNIKKVTDKLKIDLYTYVIDYEEVKKVLRSYMKASLPWIDSPTDNAISAVLVKVAKQEGVKYILNGSDFRSEGKQPTEWTYSDAKQLKYLVNKFEKTSLKSFPLQTFWDMIVNNYLLGFKTFRPYYYLPYQKKEAQAYLISKYDWSYYGGHHHENIFTKFAIAYWMPRKFGMDKRIITSSAQVMSGEISRATALEMLSKPPYDLDQMEKDKDYVIKKLELSKEEFDAMWNAENKNFTHYPSYMPLIERFIKPIGKYISFLLPYTPTMLVEKKIRG
jgi:N-acetyl sugar amidotransferase